MTDTPTLVSAWKAAQGELKAARIDSPAIDARLLLEAASGASRLEILTDPHRPLTPDQQTTLTGYLERRLRREPVSRILGRKGFWKIMLNVTPDVLSPRPDTETILDVAMLAFEPAQAFNVIDLGTGSGAILLAVLSERPGARGVGTDISSEALAVARENAANLDLDGRATFLRTEWAAGFGDTSFDLVVSNPPYIPSGDIPGLDPEVRENKLGAAEVRAVFALGKDHKVAGCMVTEGLIRRAAKARVVRGGKIIHNGPVETLRRFKDDASEVKAGFECGIKLGGYDEYQPGDIIEAIEMLQTRPSL